MLRYDKVKLNTEGYSGRLSCRFSYGGADLLCSLGTRFQRQQVLNVDYPENESQDNFEVWRTATPVTLHPIASAQSKFTISVIIRDSYSFSSQLREKTFSPSFYTLRLFLLTSDAGCQMSDAFEWFYIPGMSEGLLKWDIRSKK